ncbi:MAG: MBL fold metallo-hydrolase [Candidatus Omnitrophota bacterium]
MTIQIKFCGGARTVTGSMHLVMTDNSNVLLDCGLFQGKRDEYYANNSSFAFNPQHLDACVLSHAHIDHCGNVPNLVKQGYRSKIYSTPPTKSLCHYMLPDSGYVQEQDIKYVNKINKRKGLPPRYPIYTRKEAEKCLRYLRSVEYHKPFPITKDVTITFYEAGHILGSAIVVTDLKTSKGITRIAYAADLGRDDMPLLKNPEVPEGINYLLIESTYGGRKHDDIEAAQAELTDAVTRTIKRGGKIIIPSFALERTQLIVYCVSELMKKKKIKRIPVYVDSPLAVNVTDVFREHWRYFDDTTRRAFIDKNDPLGYDIVTYVRNVNQSKKLNDETGPMIIISASGMCENGRVLHHLKNNVENPNNTIIVVGYMAKDTLGRRIVEREKQVRIFGRPYDLNAEVVTLNAFSSHADENGLVDFVKKCRSSLRQVFIIHGEEEQSEVLRANLKKLNLKVSIPAKNEIAFLKA